MKKLLTLCFLLIAYGVFAQKQILNYSFSPHNQIALNDGFYEIQIEKCISVGEEGMPDLPLFAANFLLDPGHEIHTVTITNIEYYPVVENIKIRPREAYFPVSKGAPEGYKVIPNQQIYTTNKDYPVQIINTESILTSFKRGYALGSFLICPVIYNPVEKIAKFIKNITIEVDTRASQRASGALQFLRCDQQTMKQIQSIVGVDYSRNIDSYRGLEPKNTPNYDFLIITTSEFDGAFDDLVAHKQNWGYKVAIKFVEDIYNEYDGVDNAEKVRNCIIDYYENEGISYTMLVGDSHDNNATHNKIPVRRLYSTIYRPGEVNDPYLPADMYFACLDGNWNSNNNSNWGEPNDNCDLSHEIGVGRLCTDNVNEIKTFVDKLIRYQDEPVVADIRKVLLVGEQLDYTTYGGTAKDVVAAGGNGYGIVMQGIPSDFSLTRLYERNGYWGASDLYNQFNISGTHLINHLGHSDVGFNMKLYNSDVTTTNIQNDGVTRGFAIGYSQGCYNGSFDNHDAYGGNVSYDCINEIYMKIPTGMVANIGNSRYGWYGTNDAGPSQAFDRTFFHSIFGENIFNIGDVNNSSKDLLSGYIMGDEYLRWCCYELNLMGDPSMDIWTDTPGEFNPIFPSMIVPGDTEISIETGVAFARIALFQNGVLIGRAICDELGNATVILDASFEAGKDLTISITGHNMLRYENTIQVSSDMPVENLKASVDGLDITLSWESPKKGSPRSYDILRDGTLIENVPAGIYTFSEMAEEEHTEYDYCVEAVYSDYSLPACVSAITGVFCEIVDNLDFKVNGTSVVLTWNAPSPISPYAYEITRNGEFLTRIQENTYTDNNAIVNTDYEYCIVALYDECESEIICQNILFVGIEDVDSKLFSIYPNPAQDYLMISGSNIQRVVIYDVTGKKIQETQVDNSNISMISTSQFEDGMYLLQIYSEGKVVVKRFVIQR